MSWPLGFTGFSQPAKKKTSRGWTALWSSLPLQGVSRVGWSLTSGK